MFDDDDDYETEAAQCPCCGASLEASAESQPGWRENDTFWCPCCDTPAGTLRCSGAISVEVVSPPTRPVAPHPFRVDAEAEATPEEAEGVRMLLARIKARKAARNRGLDDAV